MRGSRKKYDGCWGWLGLGLDEEALVCELERHLALWVGVYIIHHSCFV